MMSPYTPQPFDAFMAAETSVGVMLGAFVSTLPVPMVTAGLFVAGVALAVVAPQLGEFWSGLGFLTALHTTDVLDVAAALVALGALVTRRTSVALASLATQGLLWKLTNFIKDCDNELAAAHLAAFGLLFGLCAYASPAVPEAPRDLPAETDPREEERDDAVAFLVATALAVVVCRFVEHAQTDSADEWGYTFQAALFAKLHAYGAVPPCGETFLHYWVFDYMGRRFAQYTPGWPGFMTPFMLARVPWLAGPVSLGLLAAAVSRLGRRATAASSTETSTSSPARVRRGGRLAVLMLLLSSTMLINGASRFPHVFVAALYAWAVEALLTLGGHSGKALPLRIQMRWALVLGAATSLLLATRPGDGGTLGVGLFLYFVYAVSRRRLRWAPILGAAALFAVIAGVALVILRLQLGAWFKTGYSIAGDLRANIGKVSWSMPKPNEFKWGVPLGTGAYCWFPLSPGLGLAGLITLKGPARAMNFMFFFSFLPLLALYTAAEQGRGWDFGYGPRYELPLALPMAIGAGVALTHIFEFAKRWAQEPWGQGREAQAQGGDVIRAGAFALAVAAVVVGVVRLAPLTYVPVGVDVRAHNRLKDALAKNPIPTAIVFGGPAMSNTDPRDLPENLPLDLYPDEDVLIGTEPTPAECIRQHFPDRKLYTASAGEPVKIFPLLR